MANLQVRDGAASTKYLSTDGAGTDGDPHVPHHVVDELPVGTAGMAAATPVTIASDDTLITALKTALELLDNAISGNEMLIAGGATQSSDVKVTLDSEVVAADVTGQGDVPIAIADGDDVAQGTTTDAAASASVDEDATARTHTSLLKGIKNLLIDVVGKQLADGHNVTIDNAAAGSAVNIQDGGNAITVDGTVAASAAPVADGANVALGSTTDAAASPTVAEDTTARTGIGLWKGIKNILILMNAKWAALGQAAMAASMPVVVANNQSAIPVDATGQGDVPVTLDSEQIDAGGATPVVTSATGAGAISTSYAPSAAFWLESITLHLSAAPTTSESLTITLNANDGAAYDTLLYSLDLSLSGVTDLVYTPDDGPLLCENGDAIDVAYANTAGHAGTFGLRIVTRLA